MHSSINNLQANLTEIYHVVKHPPPASLPLVANYAGTRIYDARYSLGRLWTWFYQLGTFFTGYDYRLDRLKKAVINTHNLFRTLKVNTDAALSLYIDTIRKAGKGYPFEEGRYLAARHSISQWNEATRPFIKILETHLAARLKRLLNYAFGDTYAASRFIDDKTASLNYCQNIINTEGIFEAPLPYAILNKIIKQKPLSPTETKDLGRWISRLNSADLSPGKLHKTLNALTSLYTKESEEKDVARLELVLEESGVRTFSGNDSKHLAWRDNLKEGSRISINGNELILGQELYPDEHGSDDTRVYSLKMVPNKVALIAKNKILLNLRQLKMRQISYMGIKAAKIDEISADGSVALMDKLTPLDAIGNILAYNPLNKMNTTLSMLIGSMVKEQHTPIGFTPSLFMMDEAGQLLTLRPLIAGPFDFNKLEDFALKCSGGNKELFHVLMKESGLSGCDATKFYNDYLKMHFQGDSIPIADLAGIYKIADPNIVDRCIVLTQEIKSIRTSIYAKLRAFFPNENPAALLKRINEAILECKYSSCTAGTLWPSFAEEILTQCAKGRLPTT